MYRSIAYKPQDLKVLWTIMPSEFTGCVFVFFGLVLVSEQRHMHTMFVVLNPGLWHFACGGRNRTLASFSGFWQLAQLGQMKS
jgi:hypothetical protein